MRMEARRAKTCVDRAWLTTAVPARACHDNRSVEYYLKARCSNDRGTTPCAQRSYVLRNATSSPEDTLAWVKIVDKKRFRSALPSSDQTLG